MESLLTDFRSSLRSLRLRPAFAALVIVTLALGIGATTALFSLVHGTLFAPLGHADEERLVWLAARDQRNGLDWPYFSAPDLWHFEDHARSVDALTFYTWHQVTLEEPGQVRQIRGVLVSHNLFQTLGISPILGRNFVEDDLTPGRGQVALLAESMWRQVYGGDPDILGRRIPIDGEPVTVLGVVPNGEGFPSPLADLWLPVGRIDDPHGRFGREERDFRAIARLAPGQSRDQAEQELALLAQHLEQEFPETNRNVGLSVLPLRDLFVKSSRGPILIAFGAVALVLLIACVNVANLMLTRALGRRREWAIRRALGAGRARLRRQQVVEALTLALVGGLGGLLVALWLEELLLTLAGSFLPHGVAIEIGWPVLGFALLTSLTVGGLLGWALGIDSDAPGALRDGDRTLGPDRRSGRLRQALVAGQVTLAVTLLAVALTLASAVRDLSRVDLGFDPEHLYLAHVILDPGTHGELDQRRAYYRSALEAVRSAPGIESAALASALPVPGLGIQMAVPYRGADDPLLDDPDARRAALRIVSPGYLDTAELPLLEGRDVSPQDREDAASVALVNRALADRLATDGGSAIGRTLTYSLGEPFEVTVVGVVGDTRHAGLDRPASPALFVPHAQLPFLGMGVVGRSRLPLDAYRQQLHQALLSVDPNQPPGEVRSVSAALGSVLQAERFSAQLLILFALVSLVLSALGIYATFLFFVSQRVREIGVRMALGADARRVARHVVGRGLWLTTAGLLPGLLIAYALGDVLAGTFQGVQGVPWPLLAAGAAVLWGVAALSSLLPARRASRIDPIEALRRT